MQYLSKLKDFVQDTYVRKSGSLDIAHKRLLVILAITYLFIGIELYGQYVVATAQENGNNINEYDEREPTVAPEKKCDIYPLQLMSSYTHSEEPLIISIYAHDKMFPNIFGGTNQFPEIDYRKMKNEYGIPESRKLKKIIVSDNNEYAALIYGYSWFIENSDVEGKSDTVYLWDNQTGLYTLLYEHPLTLLEPGPDGPVADVVNSVSFTEDETVVYISTVSNVLKVNPKTLESSIILQHESENGEYRWQGSYGEITANKKQFYYQKQLFEGRSYGVYDYETRKDTELPWVSYVNNYTVLGWHRDNLVISEKLRQNPYTSFYLSTPDMISKTKLLDVIINSIYGELPRDVKLFGNQSFYYISYDNFDRQESLCVEGEYKKIDAVMQTLYRYDLANGTLEILFQSESTKVGDKRLDTGITRIKAYEINGKMYILIKLDGGGRNIYFNEVINEINLHTPNKAVSTDMYAIDPNNPNVILKVFYLNKL